MISRSKRYFSYNEYLASDGANSWRYIYVLNFTDQTVSVFDTGTYTVIATIVLTSGKSFSNIQYVPFNKSIYVFGTGYFDRIDADPASAGFNTIVQSGAFTANSNMTIFSQYVPIFNGFMDATGRLALIKPDNSVDLSEDSSSYLFNPVRVNNRRIYLPNLNISPATGQVFYFSSCNVLMTTNTSGRGTNLFKLIKNKGRFEVIDVSFQGGYNGVGIVQKVGGLLITGRGGSANNIHILDFETGRMVNSFTVGNSDRIAVKYVPVGGNAGRIFTYQKQNTNVRMGVIDLGSMTNLGDIDRAAYKATHENCTNMGVYCPYDRCFYVLGGNTAATGVVNKLHRYDPTQPIGSMYVASYTVGNSATRVTNYEENLIAMNGLQRFDWPDVLK